MLSNGYQICNHSMPYLAPNVFSAANGNSFLFKMSYIKPRQN